MPPWKHVGMSYNVGRTTRQRLEGEDLFDKAAEFPLAEASVVLERLYPETVKTASEESQGSVVSAEYAVSPRGVLAACVLGGS